MEDICAELLLSGALTRGCAALLHVQDAALSLTPVPAAQQALNTKKAVLEALLSMGFTSEEAGLSLKGAPEEASETVLLQYALKRLGK